MSIKSIKECEFYQNLPVPCQQLLVDYEWRDSNGMGRPLHSLLSKHHVSVEQLMSALNISVKELLSLFTKSYTVGVGMGCIGVTYSLIDKSYTQADRLLLLAIFPDLNLTVEEVGFTIQLNFVGASSMIYFLLSEIRMLLSMN